MIAVLTVVEFFSLNRQRFLLSLQQCFGFCWWYRRCCSCPSLISFGFAILGSHICVCVMQSAMVAFHDMSKFTDMFQSCHWMWWLQHVFSGEANASTTLCSWRLWRGDCVDDRSVVSGSGFVIFVLSLNKLEWWSWMNHQWTMKQWKRWYDVSDGLKCLKFAFNTFWMSESSWWR